MEQFPKNIWMLAEDPTSRKANQSAQKWGREKDKDEKGDRGLGVGGLHPWEGGMKEEKFLHTRKSPHTQGQWGALETQKGAQRDRCSKGKMENSPQRLYQTGLLCWEAAHRLAFTHSEGELGAEAQIWRASPQERTTVDCEDTLRGLTWHHRGRSGKILEPSEKQEVIPMGRLWYHVLTLHSHRTKDPTLVNAEAGKVAGVYSPRGREDGLWARGRRQPAALVSTPKTTSCEWLWVSTHVFLGAWVAQLWPGCHNQRPTPLGKFTTRLGLWRPPQANATEALPHTPVAFVVTLGFLSTTEP